jgi:outer membrane protein TolC
MKTRVIEACARACRCSLALCAAGLVAAAAAPSSAHAQTNPVATATNAPSWLTRPLSLVDALNIALDQIGAILKAKSDLEASHGIVIQTRAVAMPKLQAAGKVIDADWHSIDRFPVSIPNLNQPHENWNSGIRIVQSVYEGGRMASALRASRLTRQQAVLQYQTVVADTLLATRVAYYDVLLAAQQIVVNEASVSLLASELDDQQRRFEAGTVPRFNVLRAEVALANERPSLIRARNDHRIAKNNLSNLLGYNLPREIWQDIPFQLIDKLDASPYSIDLPSSIARALEKRTELGALRAAKELSLEGVVNAKAAYKPSVQAFAGYGWQNSQFKSDISQDLNGWNVGGQLTWDIFDGSLTRGKVIQARALYERTAADLDDTARRIELEVRTAYSSFIEARDVLESQQKVQEEADEALRLARARAEAGTGTQLDVLDAETSLTQARTTQVQALHDYAVARAKLERAIGQDMVQK